MLVDRYGNMNSLPKLIDDKTVRTKDVRAFLDKTYPKDSLPTVEREAEGLDGQQRQARQEFSERQKLDRMAFLQGHLQESRGMRSDRAAHRPTGLAAFIGRITGVELITKKIHR